MQPATIVGRSACASALIVFLVVGCGGSLNPWTWKTQMERLISPQQLVQPDRVAQFYANMGKSTPEEMFTYIESEIQYTSDLLNHGALNHLPTAEEVLLDGKDDCDGQAILLCSVLRYAGYTAYTVIGFSHAWVEVEDGQKTLINYRGGAWFVKFNESSVEWNVKPLFLWTVEEVLLLTVFFSLITYSYEKGILTYARELLGYLKYVLLLLLIGIIVVVITLTFWIPGIITGSILALFILEVIARLRK